MGQTLTDAQRCDPLGEEEAEESKNKSKNKDKDKNFFVNMGKKSRSANKKRKYRDSDSASDGESVTDKTMMNEDCLALTSRRPRPWRHGQSWARGR